MEISGSWRSEGICLDAAVAQVQVMVKFGGILIGFPFSLVNPDLAGLVKTAELV